jgi:hypothetical protein
MNPTYHSGPYRQAVSMDNHLASCTQASAVCVGSSAHLQTVHDAPFNLLTPLHCRATQCRAQFHVTILSEAKLFADKRFDL